MFAVFCLHIRFTGNWWLLIGLCSVARMRKQQWSDALIWLDLTDVLRFCVVSWGLFFPIFNPSLFLFVLIEDVEDFKSVYDMASRSNHTPYTHYEIGEAYAKPQVIDALRQNRGKLLFLGQTTSIFYFGLKMTICCTICVRRHCCSCSASTSFEQLNLSIPKLSSRLTNDNLDLVTTTIC